MQKSSVGLFFCLFVLTNACDSVAVSSPPPNNFADVLYRHTDLPITLRVAYLSGSIPQMAFPDGENPWVAVVEPNIQQVFPGRAYVIPTTLAEMRVVQGTTQKAYTAADIALLVQQIPGDPSDLRIIFIPGLYDNGTEQRGVRGVTLPSGNTIAMFAHACCLGSFSDDIYLNYRALVHEIGHTYGLVNDLRGDAPMVTPHEDRIHFRPR